MTKPTHFRGGRAKARQVVKRLQQLLIGRVSDPTGIANGVFMAIGLAALSDIKNDFVTKADGGTGEDGIKWAPLAPSTIARRRLGPGEAAALKAAAGMKKGEKFGRHKGLLTADERKRFNKIYKAKLQRFAVSLPPDQAKKRAESIAWAELKKQGANTKGKSKVSVYANRTVKILRDTGVLLNSISPGRLESGDYEKPRGEGGDEQIFQTIANGVIVGTTVPYAGAQNYGTDKIPARPFLPDGEPPQVWQDRWEKVAEQAIGIAARLAFEEAA